MQGLTRWRVVLVLQRWILAAQQRQRPLEIFLLIFKAVLFAKLNQLFEPFRWLAAGSKQNLRVAFRAQE